MYQTVLRTGNLSLDRLLLGGFYQHSNTVIYSQPGHGLTTLMTKVAKGVSQSNFLPQGEKTNVILFITTEESVVEIKERIFDTLEDMEIPENGIQIIIKHFAKGTLDIPGLWSAIESVSKSTSHDLQAVFVDRINDIKVENKNKFDAMGQVVEVCHNISMIHDVPVITGMRVRGTEKNSDMFKVIENANVVIHNELHERRATLKTVKNRHQSDIAHMDL